MTDSAVFHDTAGDTFRDAVGAITDFPSSSGSGIPQGGPLTADVDADGFKVENAANPTNAQDYVTKAYGDANYGGGTGGVVRYFNKPAANITRANATVGAFSTAWQITGVVVASGENVFLQISAALGCSAVGQDRLLALFRGSTQLAAWNTSGSSPIPNLPFKADWIDENPGAGTYTYEVRCAVFGGATATVYQINPTTDVTGGSSIFIAEVYTP